MTARLFTILAIGFMLIGGGMAIILLIGNLVPGFIILGLGMIINLLTCRHAKRKHNI
jgi:glucose dehydrogenase